MLTETSVENIFPSSWKTLRLLQMSTLFACPSNHPGTVSVDCWTTCKAPECQISLLNLWIVNIFGQNATFLTGHSMVEQLLSLIGLPSWLSTQNQLCGCPTTKNPDAPLSAEPNWLGRCKRLLTPFRKSDMVSSGSNHTRLSLYHWFVKQKMQCVCVCVSVKGWHPPPTGAHWVPSTSQFRQRLTSVGISHARLNNNLPDSPSFPSPSCLFALFYFHTATLCLSQGLGLAAGLTATEEEGENSNNTKHRASAYSGTELEFEIRCKSPLGIIALVTG